MNDEIVRDELYAPMASPQQEKSAPTDVAGGPAAPAAAPGTDERFDRDRAAAPLELGNRYTPDEAIGYLRETDAGRALVEEWGADASQNVAFAQREAEALFGDMWGASPSAVVALQTAIRNLTPRQELAILRALAVRGRLNGDAAGGTAPSHGADNHGAAPSSGAREGVQGRLDELSRLMHSDMRKYQSPAVQRELQQLYARLHGNDPIIGLGGRIA